MQKSCISHTLLFLESLTPSQKLTCCGYITKNLRIKLKFSSLNDQRRAFELAIQAYHKHWYYNKLGILVASLILSMQSLSLYFLIQDYTPIHFLETLLSLGSAYVLTDFINGLIHMYMDNNTHYTSKAGPFIAAFHLHHKTPVYKKRHPLLVYFMESGSKFWLVFYLMLLISLQLKQTLPFYINLSLVAFGILSSVAEVSHYWCHNSTTDNYIVRFLQRIWLLLPKHHHRIHHIRDNTHYAFLNGMTDPIINRIAKHCCKGYKAHADEHVFGYRTQKNTNKN